MEKLKLGILFLIILFLFPILVSAETITLKSGKTVEGKLIEKTDKYIKIDFQGIPLTYYLDEIESIDGQKQINASGKNELVLEPQIKQTSQNSAQFNAVEGRNIEQAVFLGGTSVTNDPVQGSFPQAKLVMPQTLGYANGRKYQTNEPLPRVSVAFLGFAIVFSLVCYVYTSICLQRIAEKADQGPAWWAWVPIANLFLSCKIAGLSYLWLLIMFSALIPMIGFLCVVIFSGYLWYRIAVALNKPGWIGALTVIPIVSFITLGYLAFSKE